MGLNHWAQKQVDEKIQKYWSAFKHSAGPEPSFDLFKAWLEANEPDLVTYLDTEKLG